MTICKNICKVSSTNVHALENNNKELSNQFEVMLSGFSPAC